MHYSDNQDTRKVNYVAILAAAAALAAFGTGLLALVLAVSAGIVDTAALRGALGISEKTAWYLSRSSGTVAYLLLAGSTIWGLLLSTKLIKEQIPAALSLGMHNTLSWLAIFLAGMHGVVLLADNYYSFAASNLLVPFTGPYKPGWVGLGIVAFYLMVLTAGSFYFRKQIGQKSWKRVHYLTFAAYLLATVHGIRAGTDSGNLGMQIIYWGSGLVVLFLTNYRLLVSRRSVQAPRRESRTHGI